nr:uncharacterized protein CTRU02_14772 [Colletotrichum truncatum]KAF6781780.1 hypothetical protein CTRU02_14772 [Colletotrichum truncatum]
MALLRQSAALPAEVKDAKNTILNGALKLRQLVSGPVEFHQEMIINYQMMACLSWLLRFDIPEHVPLTGSITYDKLAQKARVPVIHLQRAVRLAIANGVFSEKNNIEVFHNDMSASFCTNPDFSATMKWMGDSNAPVAARFADMTEKWNGSGSTIHTAHNLARNTDLSFYSYLSQTPGVMAKMAGAMRFVGGSEELHIKHLVSGYDWAKSGKAVVVDMGGSLGHASIALAEAHPDLSFIVQDLPGPVEKGKLSAANLPAAIASRVTFEAHNFFQPQTRKGSSQPTIFLMRQVLANWPDEHARQILASLVPSLEMQPKSTRLLIMSKILNPPSDPSRLDVGPREEAIDRAHDVFMLQAMNGMERSMEEWKRLFATVDQRLVVETVTTPLGSQLSIIEVVLKPQTACA